MKVGDSVLQHADIRIVTASNKDLEQLHKSNLFRHDLYYRISGCIINTISLRDHREDIPLLVEHFLALFHEDDSSEYSITDQAVVYLCKYDWPGNVRQLKQVLRQVIVREKSHITGVGVSQVLRRLVKADMPETLNYKMLKTQNQSTFDASYFNMLLAITKGKVSSAIELSGMHKKNFYTKLKACDISSKTFK